MSTWENFKRELGIPDDDWGNEDVPMSRRTAKMTEDDPSLMLDTKANVIDEVKRYLNVDKFKRAVVLGSEMFEAASPFIEKPTWWNAGKSLVAIGLNLINDVERYAEDYFAGEEWVEPYSADFNHTLLKVLQKFPYERIQTPDENVFVRVCRLPNGCKVGWTYASKMRTVDHIYVEQSRFNDAREYIKKLLWEQYKENSLVMRKNNRTGMYDDSRVCFEIDDAFESKLSKRAQELSVSLQRPLNEGVGRSIMFYGPPGTGKSTLARTVVELMNLRSFRIRIADLGGLDNATLFEAINIFEPDAVILDDFDRANSQASLLETLEFFQQRVKLVVCTVNNMKKLDKALLRPGRIDMIELVSKMDSEVVKYVLGNYVDGYEIVKDWPIAYINEYVKRRKYMTVEEAAESVKELTLRVRSVERYDDSEHNDLKNMLRLMQQQDPKAAIAEDDIDDAGYEVCADDDDYG